MNMVFCHFHFRSYLFGFTLLEFDLELAGQFAAIDSDGRAVMKEALSEATNTIAWAISSGKPARLSGTREPMRLLLVVAGEPLQHPGLDGARALR